MNLRLMLLRLHVPASVRRAVLRDLIAATARAFERDLPDTARLTEPELLAHAIECSRVWAEEAIRDRCRSRSTRSTHVLGVGRTWAACAAAPPRIFRSRRTVGCPDRLRRDRDRPPPSRNAGGLDTEVRLRVRVRPRRLPVDVVDGLGIDRGTHRRPRPALHRADHRRRCGVSRARRSTPEVRREAARDRRRERRREARRPRGRSRERST